MPQRIDLALEVLDVPPETSQRLTQDEAAIRALAGSLAAHGLINPITAQADGDRARLIAGSRRLCAAHVLGWQTIPVNLYGQDEFVPAGITLAENLCRENLTPIEEAASLVQLCDEYKLELKDAAAMFGHSEAWALGRIELLKAPDELQRAVHARTISLGVAVELAKIADPTHREYLLNAATEHGCTTRQAVAWRLNWEANKTVPTRPQNVPPSPRASMPPAVLLEPCFACHQHHEPHLLQRLPLCHACVSAIVTAKPSAADLEGRPPASYRGP